MRKLVRRSLLAVSALIGLVFIAAGFAWWLLSSEPGAVWVLRYAESRSDGLVSIGTIEGPLRGRLVLGELVIELPAGTIEIDRAAVELDFSGFMARSLVIDRLELGRVTVTQSAATESPASESAQLQAPFPVLLRSFTAEEITVITEEQSFATGPVTLSGRMVGPRVDVESLTAQVYGFAARASGALDLADGLELDVAVCAQGNYEDEMIDACATITGALPRLQATAELASPFEATIAGSVELAEEPLIDVSVEWADAGLGRWPDVRSPQAQLQIFGTASELRVSGSGRLAVEDREVSLELAADTDFETVNFQRLVVDGQYGRFAGNGVFEIPTMSASFSLEGSGIDPSLVLEDWPGELSFSAVVEGSYSDSPEFAAEDVLLNGRLRGYPLAAQGNVALAAGTWRFDGVSIVSQSDRLSIDGTLGEEIALTVDADIRDAGLLWPGLSGEIVAAVDLGGTPARPRGTGRVDLVNAALGDYSVTRLSAEGSTGIVAGAVVDLDLVVEALDIPGLHVDTGEVGVSGSRTAHDITLTAAAERWSVEAALQGSLDDEQNWEGMLESLALSPDALGVWNLEAPANLSAGAGGVEFGRSCVVGPAASFCAEGAIAGERSDRLVIEANRFEVAALAPFFPEGVEARGTVSLSASLTDVLGSPTGNIALSGEGLGLQFEFVEGEIMDAPIDLLSLSAELAGGGIDASGELVSSLGTATVALYVADFSDPAAAVSGQLGLQWNDVAILSVLSPEVGDVAGQLEVDLGVSGTRGEPDFEGSVSFRDGSINVPSVGLTVDSIEADGMTLDGSIGQFSASGLVGESRIELTGEMQLDPDARFPTTLRLTGDSVPAVEMPDAQVDISPDLQVAINLPRIDISGEIAVPSAYIARVGLPEQAVRPSTDVVLHTEEPREPVRPLDMRADIVVSFGDDVTFIDEGLIAMISGDLDVRYRSGAPPSANGTLDVTGTYEAYSTMLALESSRLIFSGPWENPTLDIRAVRYIDNVTVGVELTGPLNASQSRVFSDPAMSDADALFYLLFGRPFESSTQQDAEALQRAALSMGLRQALPVIERVGETLGFDEFTVRTTGSNAGSLMAGKYLSPKLYVRYSYGLFDRIGGLLLRFRINDRLSVETQSGEHKSMDLLYTVEKN